MVHIVIDEERCTGCRECEYVCPADVYDWGEGKPVPARPSDCTECCSCVEACPEGCLDHSSCT